MRIHPLFSVKKAAAVLNVDKHFLREHLESGVIRGEKRRVGDKDKWFIYHGEVDDLRTSKRLPLLLEKAERISIDGMGDMFAPPPSMEIAGIPTEEVQQEITAPASEVEQSQEVNNESQSDSGAVQQFDASVPTGHEAARLIESLIAESIFDAAAEEAAVTDIAEIPSSATQEAAFREQFSWKGERQGAIYDTTSTDISGPYEHISYYNNFSASDAFAAEALESVSSAEHSAPTPAHAGGFTSEILNFEPSPTAEVAMPLETSLAGIPLGDFSSPIVEDTISVTDESVLSFAVDSAVETEEVVTPITNPMLRGLASVTLDEVLQKLTIQFAQRIAEERNATLELRRQLAERDESLKLLPDLEKQLQKEKKSRAKHEDEVSSLKDKISALEKELEQARETNQNQGKPWWKKVFKPGN